jgi:hypothetical protein
MSVSVIGCKDITNARLVNEIVGQAIQAGMSMAYINIPRRTEGFDRLVYRVAEYRCSHLVRFDLYTVPEYTYMDMIRRSNGVVFIWDGEDRAIASLIEYAKSRNRRVFNHVYIDQEAYVNVPLPWG